MERLETQMNPWVRKLLWVAAGVFVALQVYFVQELLAALILFSVVFVAFAALVGVLRLMSYVGERGMVRAESFVRREFRKPFRRPRSATAP